MWYDYLCIAFIRLFWSSLDRLLWLKRLFNFVWGPFIRFDTTWLSTSCNPDSQIFLIKQMISRPEQQDILLCFVLQISSYVKSLKSLLPLTCDKGECGRCMHKGLCKIRPKHPTGQRSRNLDILKYTDHKAKAQSFSWSNLASCASREQEEVWCAISYTAATTIVWQRCLRNHHEMRMIKRERGRGVRGKTAREKRKGTWWDSKPYWTAG